MDGRCGAVLLAAIGAALTAGLSGCSIAPKSFRDVANTAPLTRARAVSMGENLPDDVAVPALIGRLGDPDPVVRLSANEALKSRTHQDFGFVPWAEPAERTPALRRWQEWWAARPSPSPNVANLRRATRRRLANANRVVNVGG